MIEGQCKHSELQFCYVNYERLPAAHDNAELVAFGKCIEQLCASTLHVSTHGMPFVPLKCLIRINLYNLAYNDRN